MALGDLGRDDPRWTPAASTPLTIEITIYGWSTRLRRIGPLASTEPVTRTLIFARTWHCACSSAPTPEHRQPTYPCSGSYAHRARSRHGRPVVRGNPLHFSHSHAGRLCLPAFAAVPVGVDMEAVTSRSVADTVAAFLHPRETAELSQCVPHERPLAFTRGWVRTESYLKGLGTGLGRAPSRDYLGTTAGDASHPLGWTVQDVAVEDDHIAAVAFKCT